MLLRPSHLAPVVRRPRAGRASVGPVVTTVVRAALGLMLVGLLTGCGATPPTIGPRGVDNLTVPTPSPDPADFTGAEGIDHPVLPVEADASWELVGGGAGVGAGVGAGLGAGVVVTAAGTEQIAGVTATGLRASRPAAVDGPEGLPVTWWLAETVEGDVYLLGADGPDGPVFRAGEDGAAAGLLLAADSRVGDGYALWSVDGEPQATAEVLATDEELAVPAGVVEGVITLALDLDLSREGPEARVALADGVGPVAVEDLVTGAELVLVPRS